MSKLTDAYRTIHVVNAHDFARDKGRIWIEYRPNEYGRASISAAWQVCGRSIQTEPEEPWYNYGTKTFLLFGKEPHHQLKAKILGQAKQWANKRYGIKKWARTPLGDWMEAGFVKERMAELQRMLDQNEQGKARTR